MYDSVLLLVLFLSNVRQLVEVNQIELSKIQRRISVIIFFLNPSFIDTIFQVKYLLIGHVLDWCLFIQIDGFFPASLMGSVAFCCWQIFYFLCLQSQFNFIISRHSKLYLTIFIKDLLFNLEYFLKVSFNFGELRVLYVNFEIIFSSV